MTQFPRLVVVPPQTDRTKYLVRRFYPQAKDDDESHPKVAVATGFATTGGLELAPLAGLTAGDAKALVTQATAHGLTGPREWQVSEKSGFIFKKPSLLRGMGDGSQPLPAAATDGGGFDDLASDLVLDEAFMAKAGDLLGSPDLIATIPKRGWLMVGRCQPGQLPVMMKFAAIAEGIAGRGGRHALTKNCYFFQQGQLHGVSGSGYISLLTNPANPWNLG
jgi:hypothetical protein